MSLLFPLYLAGAAAVALPIVFHLIRRTPRGRTPFSTLMFLEPSPPRFVRRKRLNHVLLLSLRALALLLLALAFARPYVRSEGRVDAEEAQARHIVLLLDTSASMRRPDLWEAAQGEVEAILDEAPAGARLAFYTFDSGLAEHVSLEAARGLGREQTESLIREKLAGIAPTWFATDLGGALVDLAGRTTEGIRTASSRSRPGAAASGTIVLISDLQEGADLGALDAYVWPENCRLELRPVRAVGGNASLQRVPAREGQEDSVGSEGGRRVRLTNTQDAAIEEFRLAWQATGPDGAEGEALAAFCPAGESRVVRAPQRLPGASSLVLTGDACPFDNILFDRPPIVHPVEVVSIGGRVRQAPGAAEPSEDTGDLDFYLGHLFTDDSLSLRSVPVLAGLALDVARNPLVILTLDGSSPATELGPLLEHAERGGTVLVVLTSVDADSALRALLGDAQVEVSEARVPRDFAILGEIDFAHPLFAPFADPRYSDFTKIRFWKWRRITPLPASGLRVLARFEDGAPFLIERVHGAGRILVATSSWRSDDSDLARSTKFVPLLRGMLRLGPELDPSAGSYLVGDSVPLAPRRAGEEARILRPDGQTVSVPAQTAWFSDTDRPGHYELVQGGRRYAFTVHLDPRESRTDPLEPSRLARTNAALASVGPQAERGPGSRQELVHELERRQNLWRWLILLALGVLMFETFWAGRLASRSSTLEDRAVGGPEA